MINWSFGLRWLLFSESPIILSNALCLPTSSLKDIKFPFDENNPLAWIPPVFANSDWFFLSIDGELIIISLDNFGFNLGVLSFLIISKASSEDFPHTPQDEFVKKSLLIFEIFTF